MSRGPLVVVGDALLDRDLVGRAARLCPDAPVPVVDRISDQPRPGGAGLAALLAARDGRDVVLLAPFADDDAGRWLQDTLGGHLQVVALPTDRPTGEKVRVRVAGQSLLRMDYGGELTPPVALPAAAVAALDGAGAVLVADYGRGATDFAPLRDLLRAAVARVPVIWDPHPRGAPPVPGVRLATPNLAEAAHFEPDLPPGVPADSVRAVRHRAARLVGGWSAHAVAVTMGRRGALLSVGDRSPLVVPAPPVDGGDSCGAGDRFAAAAAGLLADGALPSEAVQGAVEAASAFVAAGGAAGAFGGGTARAPAGGRTTDPAPDGRRLAEHVRAAGGTVVATGGCFDLLHAGHVSTLRAARALGSCLIVCLNSDDSVRRLKGPDRPLVPEGDRVRVLEALSCVDAVVVFDEDTPERVLSELRPDVWAKGGDYSRAAMPEADLVESWGGQAVLLPFLPGRSTTRLAAARPRLPTRGL